MVKKWLLAAAATAGSAHALTAVQQTLHVNQVLSRLGAVAIKCPSNAREGDVCAEVSGSVDLLIKGWDLYSSWDSKVAITAKHESPWSRADTATSATFSVPDGDRYIVSAAPIGGKTTVAVRWAAAAGSPQVAPVTSGIQGSPSSIVTSTATPTRTGPLTLQFGDREQYDLFGKVRQINRRTVKISAGGSESLVTSETITFMPDGQLQSTQQKDASGKIVSAAIQQYDSSGRLVSREYTDSKGKITFTYEYGEKGDLISRTKYGLDGKRSEVTRYESLPNGYSSASYGPTGQATDRTYVLMDSQNREIDSETLGVLRLRITKSYTGDLISSSSFDISNLNKVTTEYKDGRKVKETSIGFGLLKGKDSIKLYKYEGLDASGNFKKRIEGKEEISFGETTLVPSDAVYQEIEYY